MTFLQKHHPAHSKIGNGAHFFSLISTLSFAVLVALNARDETATFFDPEWTKHGFCITNPEIPYWNSHDLCFYTDSAGAIVLMLLYRALRKAPGLERANEIYLPCVISILVHGLGHGALGKFIRDNDGEQADAYGKTGFELIEGKPWSVFQYVFVLLAFWIGLIKASIPSFRLAGVMVFAVAVFFIQFFFVPLYFGFTFGQTVLMLMCSVNQLARKSIEKDFTYASYAIMLCVPITLIGWMESIQCTAFVRETLYGHLVYDGFIPAGMLMWYILCYWRLGFDEDVPQALKQNDKYE